MIGVIFEITDLRPLKLKVQQGANVNGGFVVRNGGIAHILEQLVVRTRGISRTPRQITGHFRLC
jgi:hypothetical protein